VPGVVGPFALPGDAERLTGVSAVEHVNGWRVGSELSHVGVDGHSGPVALEHGSAVLVVLAEPRRRDADAKVESSDPGEKRSRIQLVRPLTAVMRPRFAAPLRHSHPRREALRWPNLKPLAV